MWKTSSPSDRQFATPLAQALSVDEVIAIRLHKNNLTSATARPFLHPDRSLVRRLASVLPGLPVDEWTAVWRSELVSGRVAVFSDYDVDGNSSAEIVKRALTDFGSEVLFGSARVEDGFGLSRRFVDEAAEWGANWLVTVDCGSTQSAEIADAQARGIRTVVIDHHDIDMDNPTDMHCNPQYARALAATRLQSWQREAERLWHEIEQARAAMRTGGSVDVQRFADPARALLAEAARYGVEALKLQQAIPAVRSLQLEYAHSDHLTGSAMSWIWGRELWKEAPEWWWHEPMYFAGLGLIADMGSMLALENRAMARLAAEHVPEGIRILADMLEETPERPSSLIRTRAALNLAKRTTRVTGDQIAQIYTGDAFATATLAAEYVQTARRKDVMLEAAREQVTDGGGWAHARLDDWPADAGQSGVIANKIARETGRPTVIFARRDDGNYKFSARNGKRNKSKIGELLTLPSMLDAAQLERAGALETSLGGHEDVVSGACSESRIPAVIAAMDAWLPPLRTLRVYDDIWVSERMVSPPRIARLVEEVGLLEPLSNDSWGVDVSAKARLEVVDETEAVGRLELEDGSLYEADLTPEAIEAAGEWREWKIRLSQGRWWLRESAPLEAPSPS